MHTANRFAATAVLATLTLAGCGDDDEPTVTPAPPVAAQTTAGDPLPSATTAASPTTKNTTGDTGKAAGTAPASVTADVRTAAPRLES